MAVCNGERAVAVEIRPDIAGRLAIDRVGVRAKAILQLDW
jgi:hypothetical protein